MALVIKSRVKETSTTTGTGALTLAGAVTGFRTFASQCATSDVCYYCIQAVDANGVPTGDWEEGLGTYTGANTLTRTTVSDSSTGSILTLAAGTKQVWIDITAADFANARLGGTGLSGAAGGNATLTGGTSTTSANAGGKANVTGGTPGATGVGGAANVIGGAGGATSGAGGAVTLAGGAPVSGAGGAVSATAAAGVGSGANGGNLTLSSGNGSSTGNSGTVTLNAGTSQYFGTGAKLAFDATGNVTLAAAVASVGSAAANMTIVSGGGGPGSVSSSGIMTIQNAPLGQYVSVPAKLVFSIYSDVTLSAGDISSGPGGAMTIKAGQGSSGNAGGALSITGGAAGSGSTGGAVTVKGGAPTSGQGGGASIVGAAGVGTNQAGGDVALTGGAATGAGIPGNVVTKSGVCDQAYSKQVPTTGFSITIAAAIQTLILDPAGTLATGTITMPAKPADGQQIRITSTQVITALTVSPNTGQSITNAPTAFNPNLTGAQGYEFIYVLANTTWYRLQ